MRQQHAKVSATLAEKVTELPVKAGWGRERKVCCVGNRRQRQQSQVLVGEGSSGLTLGRGPQKQ